MKRRIQKRTTIREKQSMKDAKGVSLREGSMVRARWKGGSQYFTGYVHNVDLDGTVSVQYDDGDFETGVQSQFIERVAKRLHPIWIAKQKDSGATFEDEGNEDLQPKSANVKPDGLISGSLLVRALRVINFDVCAVLAITLFIIIFVVWLAHQLLPYPKRVFGVLCGVFLARMMYGSL